MEKHPLMVIDRLFSLNAADEPRAEFLADVGLFRYAKYKTGTLKP